MKRPTIGIIGAGKLGITIAQLARKAGYSVFTAGSGDPKKIALTVSVLAPGAKADTKERVAQQADMIILALPLSRYASLPKAQLNGKIVIDAMNHWYEIDGPREDIMPQTTSTSEYIQAFLDRSIIVKGLSHMGYHELRDHAKPAGVRGRKAIAVAGDLDDAVKSVRHFIDAIGFDSVYIGGLAHSKVLEPGHDGFGLATTADELMSYAR